MNIKTLVMAEQLNKHLDALFLPLHRLGWPREGDEQPNFKNLFYELAAARTDAFVIGNTIRGEINYQLDNISE